jgi:hypothetical protein
MKPSSYLLWLFLGLKLLVPFVFVWVYQHLITGDLDFYTSLGLLWKDYGVLEIWKANLLNHQPFQSNQFTLFYARFFVFMARIAFDSVYLTVVVLSLLSAILYLGSYQVLKKHDLLLSNTFLLAALVPSILFWTSSSCKETLALPLFLLVLISSWHLLETKKEFLFFGTIILCALPFLAMLRYFYLPFLGFMFLLYLGIKFYKNTWFWVALVVLISSYALSDFWLLPHLQYPILLKLIYQNYLLLSNRSSSSAILDYSDSSLISLIWAFLQAYQYVFFITVKNFFSILISIENIVSLALLLFCLWSVSKKGFTKVQIALAFWVFILAGLFVLVSPNFGSLCRYRVVYWFFIWWFICYIIVLKLKSLPKFGKALISS